MRCSKLFLPGGQWRIGKPRRVWLLGLLLCLQVASARADWLALGGSAQADDFIDPASVRPNGNLRLVWTLRNLRVADKDGDRSFRSRLEYDCKNLIYRSTESFFYSEPMARGRPTGRTDTPSPWRAVEPDSISAVMQKLVCTEARK